MENIVKELRGNLTQKELAKRTGLTQSAISTFEQGRFPNPETLKKIAAAVGKKVIWSIEDLDENEKSKDASATVQRNKSYYTASCGRCPVVDCGVVF